MLTRRAPQVLFLGVVFAVAAALWGVLDAPLPNATGASNGSVPAWRLMSLASGVLPALALHSPLQQLEQVATRNLLRATTGYFIIIAAISWLLFLVGANVALNGDLVLVVARSLLAWCGLSLMSGRIIGWRLGWVLPAIVFCVVIALGTVDEGSAFPWWDFTAASWNSLSTAALSLAILVGGILSIVLDPWRVRGVTSLVSRLSITR